MRHLNGGNLVEVTLDTGLSDIHPTIEDFISEVRELCAGMTDIVVETRFHEDPHGGFGHRSIIFTGTPATSESRQ